jgi:hypothetical protein
MREGGWSISSEGSIEVDRIERKEGRLIISSNPRSETLDHYFFKTCFGRVLKVFGPEDMIMSLNYVRTFVIW